MSSLETKGRKLSINKSKSQLGSLWIVFTGGVNFAFINYWSFFFFSPTKCLMSNVNLFWPFIINKNDQ